MTATGWYNVISFGTRNGSFNPDFSDSSGQSARRSLREHGIAVGRRAQLDFQRNFTPRRSKCSFRDCNSRDSIPAELTRTVSFTNNPAWVMLDVLLRSGWSLAQLDLASFAAVAQRCDALVPHGGREREQHHDSSLSMQLLLTGRRSAGDIVRGIRNGSALYLSFDSNGLIQLNAEDTLAMQQPTKAGWQQQHGSVERRMAGIRIRRQRVFGHPAQRQRRAFAERDVVEHSQYAEPVHG